MSFNYKQSTVFIHKECHHHAVQCVSTTSKAKQDKSSGFAERSDHFLTLFSWLFTEDKISHHFMATEQSDTAPPVSSADSSAPVKSSFNLEV